MASEIFSKLASLFKIYTTKPKTLAAAAPSSPAMESVISSSGRGPDWANLLPEILVLVAKRLAALDYYNFSAVCTPWASIASPAHGMPPPIPLRKPHPFLLMRGDDGESITLLDIFDDPPVSYEIGQFPGIGVKWFVGSQFGWVALLDDFYKPSLLNPFITTQFTTLPDFYTPVYDSNGIYQIKEFQSAYFIRRLALSSDPTAGNFTAAAISGYYELKFLRPGEKTWNYCNPPMHDAIIEVMYREGKFLALTETGDVYVIDPLDLSVEDRVISNYGPRHSTLRYILDSSGDLMHVYMESESMELDRMEIEEIEVRRLDAETGAWVTEPSLGDRALFVGASCGMSIPAGNGVKGNCVYFTDNDWDILNMDEVMKMDRDMGVFDMSNMSFEVLHPPKPQFKWPPSIWIKSPLL